MFLTAILAASAVALSSLVGILIFRDKHLVGAERYVIPAAVGVFLSLVLFELIPETLEASDTWGGVIIAFGFITFYIFSYYLHDYFHRMQEIDCERKGAAMLLLTGDTVHNFADGVILGAAFLIDPAVGIVVAIGLALHEVPQEIVEFGVLIRAGYTRMKAAAFNLLSASSIILGTVATFLFAEYTSENIWIITGFVAGNLLYLAATDLLPRIHGNLKNYGSFWLATFSVIAGFGIMTGVLAWTHDTFGHGYTEEIADHEIDRDHPDEH